MVKQTQAIRRQFADKLFECVWPFYGIAVENVNSAGCPAEFWIVFKHLEDLKNLTLKILK